MKPVDGVKSAEREEQRRAQPEGPNTQTIAAAPASSKSSCAATCCSSTCTPLFELVEVDLETGEQEHRDDTERRE